MDIAKTIVDRTEAAIRGDAVSMGTLFHGYNPRTGQSIKIGSVNIADTRFGVVYPDNEDWVMVFDNNSQFKMP